MARYMKRTIILAAFAVLLAGCSSTTKLGSFCYVPYGQVGACEFSPP